MNRALTASLGAPGRGTMDLSSMDLSRMDLSSMDLIGAPTFAH